MATKTETEVLEVGVDLKTVLSDMSKWQRAMMKNMEGVSRSVDKLNKVNTKATNEAVDGNEKWSKGVEALTKTYKKEGEELTKHMRILEELQKKAASATEEEQAGLEEQIKIVSKLAKAKSKALQGKEKKEGILGASKVMKESGKELGDELKKTFEDISTLFSKDLKGTIESSAKNLVRILKAGAGGIAVGGNKLKGMGAGLADRGAAKGGAGGAAMQAGGAAMKGLGGMMSKMGPLIQMISKLGPILSIAGSAVMGLVKLFLDLDAQVKGFNKDLLQSASTAEFLGRAGGNAGQGFDKLSGTLDGIRNAAYALDNIEWGLAPDQYKAMVNVLTQEGVSLARIGKEAESSGKSVQDFTKDLAHVSVAYSRAFGVPLQEINQLQAEMMTEMGASLNETTAGFQQMTKAADESGMSANKFFGMIRGVSQDLSLWGTRMEDAVNLLGRLGKVMNPRNAQKFMQTATQGLKNMGRQDCLRLSLLTGTGKMGKLVDKDIQRKAKGLAEKFGMSGADLMKKVGSKEGRAELEGKVSKMDPSQQGALREALIDAQLQADRRKKGTFGTATAARTLGPAAALEAMQGALTKFGGGKKLSDIVGTIGGEMMAENLGISEEQLDQMAKFESSIDSQRDVLKAQLANGTRAEQESAREALKKAGITAATDKELAEKIDKAGYDDIMDTLSDGDKKSLTESAKTVDYAKSQTDLQTSLVDKMGIIIDFLMNQLYNLLMGIYDAILSFPFMGADAKRKGKIGNAELRTAAGAEDPSKAILNSKSFQDLMAALKKKSTDPAQAGQFESAIKSMAKELGPGNLASAAKMAGLDAGKIGAFEKGAQGRGRDPAQELIKTFSPEELVKIMEKATVWTGSGVTKAETVDAGMKALNMNPGKNVAAAGTAAAGGGGTAPPKVAGADTPATKTPVLVADTPATKTTATVAEDNLKVTQEQLATLHSVDNQMDAFKMDTGFLSGPYSKAVENSVLAAVRTALFEYYMYKDLDQGQVAQAMGSGGLSARQFSQSIGQGAQEGKTGTQTLGGLTANASGGTVTGVSNGLAQVTAAAGEGLASIGPGERILPRGGGGGGNTYNISVQGVGGADLAKVIEAKVIDGVHEYKRRERFTP